MVRQKRTGGQYYCEIMVAGKRYSKVCEGCTNKRDAEAYEKKFKSTIVNLKEQKSVRQLVENFRDELSGGGKVLLKDAFDLSLTKPHKKKSSVAVKAQKRAAFADFVSFMEANYPEVVTLNNVQKRHAEEYASWIAEHGRFQKDVNYQRGGRTISRQTIEAPSARTVNLYITTAKEVFRLLAEDAGIVANPFDIPKASADAETRDAFSEDELRRIGQNLDAFTRPLFIIALATAMREGDICTLQWSDIDFQRHLIRRTMRKTGNMVEIPIAADIEAYLMQQRNDSEYVFPDHAKMYLENSTGVSYRIKKFLESIGIETTKVPAGRSRAVSVKDLHSCRHTFCYLAGIRGIPISIVQSIVGHMSPDMTRHYMAHATLADKQKAIGAMQSFSSMIGTSAEPLRIEAVPEPEPEREQLHKLVDTLDIEAIRHILSEMKHRISDPAPVNA